MLGRYCEPPFSLFSTGAFPISCSGFRQRAHTFRVSSTAVEDRLQKHRGVSMSECHLAEGSWKGISGQAKWSVLHELLGPW